MTRKVWILLIVASLGYFVDIYDLILFNIVKRDSILSLGFQEEQIREFEIVLFNYQMFGMLIGGLLWGILGDKRGRVMVLFGSILLYSVANIANAFITDIEQYKILRLLAGIGLAGELGAGVTLVSETMEKNKRGIGTMIIVTFGALGAVFAALVGNHGHIINDVFGWHFLNWQIAYIIGGVMGLILLFIRTQNMESDLFKKAKTDIDTQKGNFFQFFKTPDMTMTYLSCFAIGVPIWYMVGILCALADRFSEANSQIKVSIPTCIMWTYIGLSIGDLFSGVLSQWAQSRKKVIYGYLVVSAICGLTFLFAKNQSENFYYTLTFLMGASTGYWGLFVMNTTEQFGTNLRSTASSTIPNFVRATIIPISLSFKYLSEDIGVVLSASLVGTFCFFIAFVGNILIKDGFNRNLDYQQ
jgi:putative MFS transporter